MKSKRVACINNDGYPISLVVDAIYESLADDDAAKYKMIRVIDESGEDYLYPESYFIPVEEPAKAPGYELRPRV